MRNQPIQQDDPRLPFIQANILKGHGRRFAAHLFFSIDPERSNAFRDWLAAAPITWASEQLEDTAAFKLLQPSPEQTRDVTGLYLTHAGYQAAGLGKWAPQHPAFVSGMKARQALLLDPPVAEWDEVFRHHLHGMVLLAHDDFALLQKRVLETDQAIRAFGRTEGIQRGRMIRNEAGEGIEHFGYVDGLSQPLFLQQDIDRFREKLKGAEPAWDPAGDPDTMLFAAEPGTNDSLGSYFVFRKLEQNVLGFKGTEEKLAQIMGYTGEDAETVGAYGVGRFENGAPVVLSKTEDFDDNLTNNFNYADDPMGAKCPFHAHIRKVNPRNEQLNRDKTASTNRRLIARRGIPYDDFNRRRFLDEAHDVTDPEHHLPGDVGLLFMAFMNDISDQFEFIQQKWANSPDGPVGNSGLDPVIGQTATGTNPPQHWPITWGNPSKAPFDFHGFVTMKGGEYFFAPSRKFIQQILPTV